jgi:Flp pilus assembly protein TadB
MNPAYLQPLITPRGRVIIAVATGMMLSGFAIIRQMMRSVTSATWRRTPVITYPPAMDMVRSGGIIVLVAAAVLCLAGLALLLYSARILREAVQAGRFDSSAGILTVTTALAPELIRSAVRGLKEREQQEMTRPVFRLGIPAARAPMVLIGVRAAGIGSCFSDRPAQHPIAPDTPRSMAARQWQGCGGRILLWRPRS